MYTSRCTAIGLTDPWDSLHMDNSVLPKIESSEMRRRRMEKMNEAPKTPRSLVLNPRVCEHVIVFFFFFLLHIFISFFIVKTYFLNFLALISLRKQAYSSILKILSKKMKIFR